MQLCGLIFVVEEYSYPVPLQDVSVEANTTVCQTYKNVEKNTIEAIYKFPLHEAAAVCGFEAEIDGKRRVKGIVKEAKQAAKEYDEAIQQGHGAYLLEEQFPDIFQCSIDNITAGQMVAIRITYVTELKHDAETKSIRFVFPTTIASRYGSSDYTSANDGKKLIPDKMSYTEKTDYYLKLAITYRMTSVIQSIESPSYHISTELNIDGNPNVSKITLAEQITHLEKDLILVVKSLGLNQPRAFVEYDSKTETNCVMLTLVPKFAINEIKSELIFVIDRSGSMQGGPIKKASETIQLLLRSLPKDYLFNVVSFGSRFDSLFTKSQPYSKESFSKALKHAQEIDANYRGTEIYNPLKWTFENSKNDMSTSIFLLTDGQVYNVDQIVELIKSSKEKKKDDLRLFSIGIGDSVSHHLVESVSRAGKGYAQFVTNNEQMDKKILGMLKNAIKPPIKDYNITWTNQILEDTLPVETNPVDKPTISFFSDNSTPPPNTQTIFTDMKIQQAPFLIPPIYPGARFIVYCILEKGVEPCKEIILSAISQDARKLIQDLEGGASFIHKNSRNKEKNISNSLICEQIVKLGVTYNLASKYTSFIAIDERDSELVSEAKILSSQRIVPVAAVPFLLSLQPRKTMTPVLMASSMSFGSVSKRKESSFEQESADLSTLINRNDSPPASTSLAASVKSKPPNIETLYSFLNFQSFDGSFLPSDKF
ncbi:von willebrand domain-containing protein [Gigaspora margarita]|uniref:von willebrand domain-containing protein n=1 Tax=Gigaspora margarita TaxID=4874 RepID=A0A8H4A691_GIGMA|nr:von willebrand domain-containing protein [Gigaspora margarita]